MAPRFVGHCIVAGLCFTLPPATALPGSISVFPACSTVDTTGLTPSSSPSCLCPTDQDFHLFPQQQISFAIISSWVSTAGVHPALPQPTSGQTGRSAALGAPGSRCAALPASTPVCSAAGGGGGRGGTGVMHCCGDLPWSHNPSRSPRARLRHDAGASRSHAPAAASCGARAGRLLPLRSVSRQKRRDRGGDKLLCFGKAAAEINAPRSSTSFRRHFSCCSRRSVVWATPLRW